MRDPVEAEIVAIAVRVRRATRQPDVITLCDAIEKLCAPCPECERKRIDSRNRMRLCRERRANADNG
jgi:hypothetical protein